MEKKELEIKDNKPGERSRNLLSLHKENLLRAFDYISDNDLGKTTELYYGQDISETINCLLERIHTNGPLLLEILNKSKKYAELIEKKKNLNNDEKDFLNFLNLIIKNITKHIDIQKDIASIHRLYDGIIKNIDPKTKGLSRMGFNRRINDEFSRFLTEAHIENFATMLIDQNKLKEIIDTYGHDVGQEAILEVGRTIEEILEENWQQKLKKQILKLDKTLLNEYGMRFEDIKLKAKISYENIDGIKHELQNKFPILSKYEIDLLISLLLKLNSGKKSKTKFLKVGKSAKLVNKNYHLSNYTGGDEWYIILTNETKSECGSLIEKILSKLKTKKIFSKSGDQLYEDITLSFCAGICHIKKEVFNNWLKENGFTIKDNKHKYIRNIINYADYLLGKAKSKKLINKKYRIGSLTDIAFTKDKHGDPKIYIKQSNKNISRIQSISKKKLESMNISELISTYNMLVYELSEESRTIEKKQKVRNKLQLIINELLKRLNHIELEIEDLKAKEKTLNEKYKRIEQENQKLSKKVNQQKELLQQILTKEDISNITKQKILEVLSL